MRPDPGPVLLHNMSAPPKTTVTWHGLSGLLEQPGPGGPGVGSARTGRGQAYGQAVRFALPEDCSGVSPLSLLRYLGHPPGRSAKMTLLAQIQKRADALPLPDGCVVVAMTPDAIAPWPDLLSALAVLTKCSQTVWLRSKAPALSSLDRRRAVTLLVPPPFTDLMTGIEE